ncbi:MAG: hypothetical protein K9M75_00550 [Phycisphaerae bacterium]|nr:hypothetical protein [Phycisphaerae bacterium]
MVMCNKNISDDNQAVQSPKCSPADRKTVSEAAAAFDNLDTPVIALVKTCGGTTFCPKGKQDSLDLGLILEERLHNIYLPAKLYIAVSGCENHCVEVCAKDIGIIGAEEGWDIIVSGNTRTGTKHARSLARGLSTPRVIEVVDKIVALFRTGYKNKKQLSKLIERIGFENFKAKVLTQNKPANR